VEGYTLLVAVSLHIRDEHVDDDGPVFKVEVYVLSHV